MTINSFKDGHFFLSNFSTSPIKISYGGADYIFPTGEHCFQGMKIAASNMDDVRKGEWLGAVANAPTPSKAKYLGRSIQIDIDRWDRISYGCMERTQKLKYEQNADLAKQLIATHPHELIEGTTWNDTVWGVDENGYGKNLLGFILMDLRNSLIAKATTET